MTTMNRQFNVPELQATMREFQKQSEMMGMKQEVGSHACASAAAEIFMHMLIYRCSSLSCRRTLVLFFLI